MFISINEVMSLSKDDVRVLQQTLTDSIPLLSSVFKGVFLTTFTLYFLQLYCPIGIFPMGNLDCFPQGKPAATESCYPRYGGCWVFTCFHNSPNSGMDYKIFNVCTDVNACNCTWGCTDTIRESARKVDWKKKPMPCWGIKPVSWACQSDALPTELYSHCMSHTAES